MNQFANLHSDTNDVASFDIIEKCSGLLYADYLLKVFIESSGSMVSVVVTRGCSGAGTRGNGVPTPLSRFALK